MAPNTDDLGRQMRIGALWAYLQTGVNTVWQFAGGIVLARILDPADFGVFAAVTAFTAVLSHQVVFGLSASLLQAREIEHRQWNSSFWFMEGVALICTLSVFAAAGWLQEFFEDSRYAGVMLLMCVNFFIMPYMTINGSLLRRQMDYKSVSQVQLVAGLFAPVWGIAAALAGWGPYSLVVSGIMSSLISTVMMARKAPWRPTLDFSLQALLPLLSKAWRFHLNGTLNRIANRVDNVIIGKVLNVAALGLYTKAFSLARMPLDEVTIRLYQIVFTGLSRVQENQGHSVRLYQKTLCALSSATFPLLLVLAMVGEGLVVNLYGDKWQPAVLPMQVMAVGSFAAVLTVTLGALADAQGLMARETPIQAFNIVMTLAAVLIGARWGLVGVAVGIALKGGVMLVLMQRLLASSPLGMRWHHLLHPVWPALVASGAGAATGGWVAHLLASVYSPRHALFMLGVATTVLAVYIAVWGICAWLRPANEPLQTTARLVADVVRGLVPERWRASVRPRTT